MTIANFCISNFYNTVFLVSDPPYIFGVVTYHKGDDLEVAECFGGHFLMQMWKFRSSKQEKSVLERKHVFFVGQQS